MTVGEKIAKIRTFRGITQKELGLQMGFNGVTAQTRMTHYETNYRVPKEDGLKKLAELLNVHPINFGIGVAYDSDEYHMQHYFWLEEFSDRFDLLPYETDLAYNKDPDKLITTATISRNQLTEFDDGKMTLAPFGIVLKVDRKFATQLRKWQEKKRQLKNGELTREHYFEWKLQWPKDDDVNLATGKSRLDVILENSIKTVSEQ